MLYTALEYSLSSSSSRQNHRAAHYESEIWGAIARLKMKYCVVKFRRRAVFPPLFWICLNYSPQTATETSKILAFNRFCNDHNLYQWFNLETGQLFSLYWHNINCWLKKLQFWKFFSWLFMFTFRRRRTQNGAANNDILKSRLQF